jgi:bacteriorhodopsin
MKNLSDMTYRSMIYLMLALVLLITMGLVIASVDSFIEYSSFTIGLAKAILGILLLKIVDDTVFGKIDTIPEIKNKNVSYALIYLANALIIAACIASA